MKLRELTAKFDSKASFYGKATVLEDGAKTTLYSYNTEICTLDKSNNSLSLKYYNDFSSTTLRHVKEFLRQNGYNVNTKKEVIALFNK